MLKESEQLAMLHHRFCRTLEIEVAYHSFLKKEVMVGESYYCLHEPLREDVTHTLLVTYYSYIYSLFDPSGVHIGRLADDIVNKLPVQGKEALAIANDTWEEIKAPISKIRNTIGSHNSPKKSGVAHGYGSYSEIHPLATLLIIKALRLFFRNAYKVYEPEEPLSTSPTDEENDILYQEILKTKGMIEKFTIKDIQKIVQRTTG
ncbi:hypothetical protein L4D21_25885 [Photobacterium profundum]|uniref:hypothetical protein n=1 Tax=Photobacterium profundum TaxID=74109 RepID=UPI003D121D5D